jgi:hypothetical protein
MHPETVQVAPRPVPETREEILRRWPRLAAHVICESLGYWSPLGAAGMIRDFKQGKRNYSEYVASCWQGDPAGPLRRAIASRHSHNGYMASYPAARSIVDRFNADRTEPNFGLGSWF